MIRINAITTSVEPIVENINHPEKGMLHDLQDGSVNADVTIVKFEMTLFYSRLTQAEFDDLEALAHTEGNSSAVYVTLTLNERLFDGTTVDTNLGRILKKMKITAFEETPMIPYADGNTYRGLRVGLKES